MSAEPLADTGPGAALAAARQTAELSQREVSEALNLPINIVDALETDDQSRLPAFVFTRGYLRAYAKLLEIDPDPLVAALARESGQTQEPDSPVAGPQAVTQGLQISSANALRLGAGAVAVILVVILLFSVFGGDETTPNPVNSVADAERQNPEQQELEQQDSGQHDATTVEVAASTTNAAVATDAQQPNSVVSGEVEGGEGALQEAVEDTIEEVASETSAESTLPAVATDEPPLSDTPASANDAAAIALTAANTTGDQATRSRRVTDTGDDRLWIEFSEDCWVEIRDTAGVSLFGDLGRAGESIELVGAAPFRILLGYAPGALLKFNAEPVALSPHTRNNVAKLVLGQ